MSHPIPSPTAGQSLPRGQMLFVVGLLLVGVCFLGLAAYRAFNPPAKPAPVEPDLAQQAEDDLALRGYKPLSQSLAKLINDPKYKPVPTQAPLLLGEPAPDFALEEVNGKKWKLADHLRDGPLVVVFYFGYNCNHCVSQLFGLNKDLALFTELGAHVVAISADPPELTRERFKKYGAFAFPVLSDPGNKVAQRYGVYHPGRDGKEGDLMHGTFVIDRRGKICWINSGDEPFTQNQTLLVEIAKVEGRQEKK